MFLEEEFVTYQQNSMNKTFATFKNFIRQDDYLNSVKGSFYLQDTYKEFP